MNTAFKAIIYFFTVTLFIICSTSNAIAQEEVAAPPKTYSEEVVEGWIQDEVNKVNPQLGVRLLTTAEWHRYVNNLHFVPLTCEGVPKDHVFNYTWDGSLSKQERIDSVHLPTAEVVETGEFIMWGDRCNFFELTEKECKDFIHYAVTHEQRHFIQWQGIATASLEFATGMSVEDTPTTLSEVAEVPGAMVGFWEKWADCPHYQCREVEVYTEQIATGEMSEDTISQKPRLQTLHAYYKGCSTSKWRDDFKDFLVSAESIFEKFDFDYKQ